MSFYQGQIIKLSDVEIKTGNVYCPACTSPMLQRAARLDCVRCYVRLSVAEIANWPREWTAADDSLTPPEKSPEAPEEKPEAPKKKTKEPDKSRDPNAPKGPHKPEAPKEPKEDEPKAPEEKPDGPPASDDGDEPMNPIDEMLQDAPIMTDGVPETDEQMDSFIQDLLSEINTENWSDPTIVGALQAMRPRGARIRLVKSSPTRSLIRWDGRQPREHELMNWVASATGRVPTRIRFRPKEKIAVVQTIKSAEDTVLEGLEAEVPSLNLKPPIQPTPVQEAIALLVRAEEEARANPNPAVKGMAMRIAGVMDDLVGKSTTIQFTSANAKRWCALWSKLASGQDGVPLDRVTNQLGQSEWVPGDPAGFACAMAAFVHKHAAKDEKEIARKMQKKGYGYIIIFDGGQPEPLYTKGIQQAAELMRTDYKDKRADIMMIDKFLAQ